MTRLYIFDFDSISMDGETTDILAKARDEEKEVVDITYRAMAGELDFFESLQERVNFLKGMSYDPVLKIGQSLPLMNRAYELIEFLNSKNIFVVILSGGFHEGIDLAVKKLKVNLGFANYLHHKNNTLSGLVGGEIMFSSSEGSILQRLKNFLNLQTHEIMCVNNGANDIATFSESDLEIAFCTREILRSKTDIYVDNKDLKGIVRII